MGELQQKCNEKIVSSKSSRALALEHEHTKQALCHEIKRMLKLPTCTNNLL